MEPISQALHLTWALTSAASVDSGQFSYKFHIAIVFYARTIYWIPKSHFLLLTDFFWFLTRNFSSMCQVTNQTEADNNTGFFFPFCPSFPFYKLTEVSFVGLPLQSHAEKDSSSVFSF